MPRPDATLLFARPRGGEQGREFALHLSVKSSDADSGVFAFRERGLRDSDSSGSFRQWRARVVEHGIPGDDTGGQRVVRVAGDLTGVKNGRRQERAVLSSVEGGCADERVIDGQLVPGECVTGHEPQAPATWTISKSPSARSAPDVRGCRGAR